MVSCDWSSDVCSSDLENIMLDATLKTQLKSYLEKVVYPLELVASLDDSAKAREMKELLFDMALSACTTSGQLWQVSDMKVSNS